MQGSFVEELETDSQNIVDIIKERYTAITSSVTAKVDNSNPDISVTLRAKCPDSVEEETDTCDNVSLGSSVEFIAEVKVRKCLTEPSFVTISPVGLNQSLTVEINTICDCDCEAAGSPGFIANAPSCSNRGKELIHLADPQLRLVVIIVLHMSVRPAVRQNRAKQTMYK